MTYDIVLIATILFVTDNIFNRYELKKKKTPASSQIRVFRETDKFFAGIQLIDDNRARYRDILGNRKRRSTSRHEETRVDKFRDAQYGNLSVEINASTQFARRDVQRSATEIKRSTAKRENQDFRCFAQRVSSLTIVQRAPIKEKERKNNQLTRLFQEVNFQQSFMSVFFNLITHKISTVTQVAGVSLDDISSSLNKL